MVLFQLLNMTATIMMSMHMLLLLIMEKDDSIVNAIADMKLMLYCLMSTESVYECNFG